MSTISRRDAVKLAATAAICATPSMSMAIEMLGKFEFENWAIQQDWVKRFEEPTVLGNKFSAHLLETMKKLKEAFGENLRIHANTLTNVNGPTSDHPFSGEDLKKYLENGDFPFTKEKRLIFVGPTEDMTQKPGPDGSVILAKVAKISDPAQILFLNFPYYIWAVEHNADGLFDPNDMKADKIGRFHALLGKTILHEMMHLVGFTHPKEVSYDPKGKYMRSFPKVAEQAYLNRVKDIFPAGYGPGDFGLVQNGPKVIECGTK